MLRHIDQDYPGTNREYECGAWSDTQDVEKGITILTGDYFYEKLLLELKKIFRFFIEDH